LINSLNETAPIEDKPFDNSVVFKPVNFTPLISEEKKRKILEKLERER